MHRLCSALLVVSLLVVTVSAVSAGEGIERTRFGIGFQASFPAWGFSGVADLTDQVAVQGIFGFFGDLRTYAGRGLYRFSRKDYWNVYGYAAVGSFSYTGLSIDDDWTWDEKTETVVGFGAGVGLEYDWRAWSPNLPPMAFNLELGAGSVKFEEVDYNFSSMMIGVGLHFRF